MASLFYDAQVSGVQWFRGIIHVGANVGQEVAFYARLKDVPTMLIEPIPQLIRAIEAEVSFHPQGEFIIEQRCCSDEDDQVIDFHVSSDPRAQASSILEPGTIVEQYPWLASTETIQLKTITLDRLLERHHPDFPVNMLAIDTQGADLKVLKGAEQTLKKCDGIYIEVSDTAMYKGGCTFKEIIEFLDARDFGLYRAVLKPQGWGNAFFMRRNSPYKSEIAAIAARNVATGKPTSCSTAFRGKAKPFLIVDGDVARSRGYRSQGNKDDEWVEIDLEGSYRVSEIILVGPTMKNQFGSIKVKTRSPEGRWQTVYDYADEQKILSRFDRIPMADTINAVRIESEKEQLMLAQVLVIEAES